MNCSIIIFLFAVGIFNFNDASASDRSSKNVPSSQSRSPKKNDRSKSAQPKRITIQEVPYTEYSRDEAFTAMLPFELKDNEDND